MAVRMHRRASFAGAVFPGACTDAEGPKASRLIVAAPGEEGAIAQRAGQRFIGRQGYFAGSLARASRTAPEPVRTPKIPFSTVTM